MIKTFTFKWQIYFVWILISLPDRGTIRSMWLCSLELNNNNNNNNNHHHHHHHHHHHKICNLREQVQTDVFFSFSFLSFSFLVPLFGGTKVCNYLSQFVITLRASSSGRSDDSRPAPPRPRSARRACSFARRLICHQRCNK